MSARVKSLVNPRALGLPPLRARLADERPVLSRTDLEQLTKKVLHLASADTVRATVRHTAQVTTRLANGQVLSGDDGDTLYIEIETKFRGMGVLVNTNQLNDSALQAAVAVCEAQARQEVGPVDSITPQRMDQQDTMVPVTLWHPETVRAMTTSRKTVIPEMLSAVAREGLQAAGFVGLMARAECYVTKAGLFYFSEETDSEVTVTARTPDGKGAGWAGQAHRDWSRIRHQEVATRAATLAKLNAAPQALEPGRRTAILTPPAVIQILRFLAMEYDADDTDRGETAFSRLPRGNKLRQRVFDPRINMRSDPNDPDGGYRPYFVHVHPGATPAMSWVENGVLKNLAYDVDYALERGKIYAEMPWSLRVSGGPTSIDQMIAQCQEGIYVNRFSDVNLIDKHTGLTTGVTSDGCFLVKDGKITKAVKNFRFVESPFFFLNNIKALGVPERAAFGYTPRTDQEPDDLTRWPRRPMIAPPMMVADFNFAALADAV